MNEILIIAPHPDDEYFIAECFFNLYKITVCLVTNGDSNFEKNIKGHDYRLSESENYAKMIGAKTINLNISCKDLNKNLLSHRLSCIDFSKFELVCLVDPYDWHPDHRLITNSVVDYLDCMCYIGDLIFYEVTSRGLSMRSNVKNQDVKYDLQHIIRRNCFKSQLKLLKREDFRRLKGLNLQFRYSKMSVEEAVREINSNCYGTYDEVIIGLISEMF